MSLVDSRKQVYVDIGIDLLKADGVLIQQKRPITLPSYMCNGLHNCGRTGVSGTFHLSPSLRLVLINQVHVPIVNHSSWPWVVLPATFIGLIQLPHKFYITLKRQGLFNSIVSYWQKPNAKTHDPDNWKVEKHKTKVHDFMDPEKQRSHKAQIKIIKRSNRLDTIISRN